MSGEGSLPTVADAAWQNYRHLADAAIDVVLEADLRTVMQWVSPSAEDVLGWLPSELVGRSAADIVHPDDMPEIGALAQSLNQHSSRVHTQRCRLLTKAGTYKAMQLGGRPALADDGTLVGHVITLKDTTERDDALRALSVLSEGNRVLARSDDEASLLQQMCQTIVTSGGYPLAWYGRRIAASTRSVEPAAAAGPSIDYLDTIAVTWDEGPLGQGPTGTAVRTGKTQVRNSFADSPSFAPWREAAEAASLSSSISLPVRAQGEIDGALMVYATEANAFDVKAQRLLETLASDLGLGLDRLRTMMTLQDTIHEAREQRERLRGVFTSQFDPFVLLEGVRDDAGGLVDLRYVEASAAAAEHNGVSREQMVGSLLSELLPGQVTDGIMHDLYFHTIETGEPLVLDDYPYFHELRKEWRTYDVRGVKSGDALALTFRDVTERAEAVKRLADSEARYRLLAENSSDVIWETQDDGRLLWTSESVTSVLGWRPDEIIGRGLDLVHPDDLREQQESLAGVGRGLTVDGEVRIAHRDGSWRWMSFSIHRVVGDDRTVNIVALHDIHDEVRARTALDHAMGHDPLTGLAARPAMLTRLADALGRLDGPRRLVGVLCVGVDRLSSINDAYTHAAGDVVLTLLAARIADAAGTPDLVGRGAGVEFLVLLPDIPSGDAAAVLAERILEGAQGTVAIGENTVDPTVSIGIAIGDRHSDPEQLVRDASTAMGQAKADGRDRFAFADAGLAGQAQRRLTSEAHIRKGLREDRFVPLFQPIVRLSDGSLAGYEALARAVREDGTIAPPANFIAVAELSPLICEIDIVVLHKSLAALASLPAPLTMSVNVATATLTRPGYAHLILDAIRASGVEPSRLHLEVTETTLLGVSTQVQEVMAEIAAVGVRWYVDDFGTGYSSIAHLRDLPVAGLKLDLSFSAGIREGHVTSVRLAQALAGLSRGLELDTVAEGVETAAEADVLRSQGWLHGQGWLYGRPAPLP